MTDRHNPAITPYVELVCRDLGRMGYEPAFEVQRERNQAVIDGCEPSTLLLVEHDPVLTLTRRKGIRDHIVATDKQLAAHGVAVCETDRGGDITYHGPGQIVAYPILRLGDYNLNLSRYMRLLEQTVIDTLAEYGVRGQRDPEATGVWVDLDECVRTLGSPVAGADAPADANKPGLTIAGMPEAEPTVRWAKICAMGVRIRKNVTMHGLALNVCPQMSHFMLIVPCGLHDRPVVSLKQLLGDQTPTVEQVQRALAAALNRNLAIAVVNPQAFSRG